MKKLSMCAMLLVAAIGCGKSDSSSGTLAQGGNADKSMSGNVALANGASPAVASGAGTEPGEVVAVFLDSLRRGDENAANAVLTTQALAELAKTDFVIQPLGTPEGTYKIGRVGFPDPQDKTVALVECLWTEPNPEPGQTAIELDIVCEVRQETPGWRISGLAVKLSGTEDTLVLDFEDAASLQQALQQAGGGQAQPTQPGQPTQTAGQIATQPSQLPPQGFAPQPGSLQPGLVQPGMAQPGTTQTAAPQNQFAAPATGGFPQQQPVGLPGAPGFPTSGFPTEGAPTGQIALPPPGMLPGQQPVNR